MMTKPQKLGPRTLLGFGLGLRRELMQPILTQLPRLDWLEILTDCYLQAEHLQLAELIALRAHYPLVMHGGTLSIGGPDPLDNIYLDKLQSLVKYLQPVMVSDHLCWTPPGGSHSYDLRPLPRNQEMIEHLKSRINRVQECLGQRILLENISDSSIHEDNQMPEWQFLGEVAEASDSLILLDLNNILSNSIWAGFDPIEYIRELPAERIWQIHLAPRVQRSEYDWDADSSATEDPIWHLYREVIRHCGPVATMLERNDDIPPLEILLQELDLAKRIVEQI